MDDHDLKLALEELSTPNVADACLRLGVPLRIAALGIRPARPGSRLTGRALPVEHYGSVDIFFEAMEGAEPGDVLVIGNQGRMDEGCAGDLTVLEAKHCGMSGIVIWGCHRDTRDLLDIGLPVFSYGVFPAGPTRLDDRPATALTAAHFGDFDVTRDDFIFADDDGVMFVPASRLEEIVVAAAKIHEREKAQADASREGRSLRDQLRFRDYLTRRLQEPSYSFRQHLRHIGGAIEE